MFRLFIILLVGAAAGTMILKLYIQEPEELVVDNAYVSGRIMRLFAPISGHISSTAIDRNLVFDADDVIVEFDDTLISLEIQEKQFELRGRVEEQMLSCFALSKAKREREQLQVMLDYRQQRLDRAKTLSSGGASLSREVLEDRQAEFTVARENVAVAAVDIQRLSSVNKLPILERPMVKQTEVLLRSKLHQRSLHRIQLPFSAYVYESLIYPGKYVQEGELLAVLVPQEQLVIEANVLESKLDLIEPMQRVEIRSDAYPDRVFEGYVQSVVPSTASTFSNLPRNNTDSNWIKVAQRVPVIVAFSHPPDTDVTLALGSSAQLTILLNDRLDSTAVNSEREDRALDHIDIMDQDDYVQSIIDEIIANLSKAEKQNCAFLPPTKPSSESAYNDRK